MPITIAELKVMLGADTSSVRPALEGAVGATESAANRISQRWQAAGANMSRVGAVMTAGITAPLMLIGRSALKTAGDFEQTMNVFQSGAKASAREMDEARKLAIALGNDMKLPGTSASDAGQAMLQLAQHGLKVKDVFAATRGVLQLSAAGHMSNAAAAKITASTLNAFRLEGSQATRVADMLAAAHLNTGSAMGKLGFAIRNGAAAFAQAKIPLADFATSVALLARSGIEGQRSGTGLATMLQKLIAPGAEGAKAMAALQIHLYDAHKNMLPWPAILEQIRGKLAQLPLDERNDAMKRLFGTGSSFAAAAVLLKAGAAGFDEMKQKMEAQGTAARLAEAQMKGYKGAVDQFKSAIDTAYIVLSARFLPTITNLINRGSDLITRFANLSPATQNIILTFAGVAAAVGPLLVLLGQLASGIGAISAALPVLGAAFTLLTGPIGLVVAGVVALGVAWATNFGGMRTQFNAFIAAIAPPFRALWAEIRATISAALPYIRGLFTGVLPVLKDVWASAWQTILGVLRVVVNHIVGVIRIALALLRGDIPGALRILVSVWRSQWDAVRSIISGFVMFLGSSIATIATLIKNAGEMIVTGLVKGLSSKMGEARTAVQKLGTTIIGSFKSALGISSPSTVFAGLGVSIIEGLAVGIESQEGNLAARYEALMQRTHKRVQAKHRSHVEEMTRKANEALAEALARTRAETRSLRADSDYDKFALQYQGASPDKIRAAYNEVQTMEALREQMGREKNAAAELKRELEALHLAQLKLAAVTEEERVALDKFGAPLASLSVGARRAVTEFVALRNEMEAFNRAVKIAAIEHAKAVQTATRVDSPSMDVTTPAWKRAPGPKMGDGTLVDLPKEPAEMRAEKLKSGLRQAGEIFNGVLSRSIDALKERGIRGFFQTLTQSLSQTIQQLMMDLAKSAALRALGGGAGGGGIGGLAGIAGSLGGALPWVAGGLALNSALGNPIKKIGKMLGFADGGRPPMGDASIVGERGPELFVPDRPGTIVPLDRGRAGSTHVQFVNYGSIQHEADEMRLARHINQAVQRSLRFV